MPPSPGSALSGGPIRGADNRVSQVGECHNQLVNIAGTLESMMDTLESRLNAVVRVDPPAAISTTQRGAAPERGPLVPLGEALTGIYSRLSRVAERIDSLTNRIEV